MHAYRPTCLPAYLPAYLPACLPMCVYIIYIYVVDMCVCESE